MVPCSELRGSPFLSKKSDNRVVFVGSCRRQPRAALAAAHTAASALGSGASAAFHFYINTILQQIWHYFMLCPIQGYDIVEQEVGAFI